MENVNFFPWNMGLTVTIVVAVVIVAICILAYWFYKRLQKADSTALEMSKKLCKAQSDIKTNEDAIAKTNEELLASKKNIKETMRAKLEIEHKVQLRQMELMLEKMARENESGKEYGYLDDKDVAIKNAKYQTICELIKSELNK